VLQLLGFTVDVHFNLKILIELCQLPKLMLHQRKIVDSNDEICDVKTSKFAVL
jgi:hypothetical protein